MKIGKEYVSAVGFSHGQGGIWLQPPKPERPQDSPATKYQKPIAKAQTAIPEKRKTRLMV
jgi:hypothetical protein